MIKRIDIKNCGVFRDFEWKSLLRGNRIPEQFKRLNILYGRNYSGKTTLSRIVRSLETGELPPRYENREFRISFADSARSVVTQANLQEHGYTVRVYNRDFVESVFSFERTSAASFAVVGTANVEHKKRIEQLEQELGDPETEGGWRYRLRQREASLQEQQRNCREICNERNETYSEEARGIKNDLQLGQVNYKRPGLEKDLGHVVTNNITPLSDEEANVYRELLKEEARSPIGQPLSFDPAYADLVRETRELLARRIEPTEPIQDLVNDSLLEAWVRHGIDHHRGKRESCAFCGQSLPKSLWQRLDRHFNEESERLRGDIDALLERIDDEFARVDEIELPPRLQFAADLRNRSDALQGDCTDAIQQYRKMLGELRTQLLTRRERIFETVSPTGLKDADTRLEDSLEKLRQLVREHNIKAASLSADQEEARGKLRLDHVARFVDSTHYKSLVEREAKAKTALAEAEAEVQECRSEVRKREDELEGLRAELQDERRGAEKVNEYLKNFFGHQSLQLVAIEDGEDGVRFEIRRGDNPAHNLSEGERSLLAFCYFVATLSAPDVDPEKLILWIDDPISSLDSNHVFFVYSLIENEIARKTGGKFRYLQAFLATHSLECLKYFKTLTAPYVSGGNAPGGGSGKKKADREYFFVSRTDGVSQFVTTPKCLKEYSTEFNYLFEQVYKAAQNERLAESLETQYTFGNNLRRFLEAYLYYRYPCHGETLARRIERFFDGDGGKAHRVNRMVNEYSHLQELPERSFFPADHAEVASVAKLVVDQMEEKDPDQFKALLRSVGKEADLSGPRAQ